MCIRDSIGIEHPWNVFSDVPIKHRLDVVARVERLQVERVRSLCTPQPQSIADIVSISWDGVVVWHGQHDLGVDPLSSTLCSINNIAIEVHWHSVLRSTLLNEHKSQAIKNPNFIVCTFSQGFPKRNQSSGSSTCDEKSNQCCRDFVYFGGNV